MALTPEEQLARANDIAAQIAMAELLRVIISETFYVADRQEFRNQLVNLEDAAISGIARRRLFSSTNDATESYIKEAASGWITSLLASIIHPDDRTSSAPPKA